MISVYKTLVIGRKGIFQLTLFYLFLFLDEEMHMDIHDRALLYYRLLKTDAKEVLLGDVII